MENVNISSQVRKIIQFGLITLLVISAIIGYAVFQYYHATKNYQIENAKVTGTMVSVRVLVNGKIQELMFKDGDEVKAGDVIAKVEVSVTPEEIQSLEEALEMARQNYEELKLGQTVKVPIKKTRVVEVPQVPQVSANDNPDLRTNKNQVPATLESLAERARRMDELYEMGAVSAVQRDAAKQKYQDALAEGILPETSSSESSSSSSGTKTIEEIEYVDQWQPTPPAVLATAESAIKQAELALNVAKQKAQKTEIIAPVSGIIYYSVGNENTLEAGNVVAKVGSTKELWLEAEVDEDIFNKIPLGKKVSYTLENKNLSGTVTEKISPTKPEEVEEKPAETPPENVENKPAENTANPETSPAENLPAEIPTEIIPEQNPPIENKITATDADEPINDKYILKFSIPAENDIEIKPNAKTVIKISI